MLLPRLDGARQVTAGRADLEVDAPLEGQLVGAPTLPQSAVAVTDAFGAQFLDDPRDVAGRAGLAGVRRSVHS